MLLRQASARGAMLPESAGVNRVLLLLQRLWGKKEVLVRALLPPQLLIRLHMMTWVLLQGYPCSLTQRTRRSHRRMTCLLAATPLMTLLLVDEGI